VTEFYADALAAAAENDTLLLTMFCAGCGRRRGHVCRLVTDHNGKRLEGPMWVQLKRKKGSSAHDPA